MKKHKDSVHHRRPRSQGGTDTQRNLSIIPAHKHQAWHLLFDNKSPYEIAAIINAIYLDPDYFFVCKRKENYRGPDKRE